MGRPRASLHRDEAHRKSLTPTANSCKIDDAAKVANAFDRRRRPMPTKRVKKGGGAKRLVVKGEANGSGGAVLPGPAPMRADPIEMDKDLLEGEAAYYRAHLDGWREHEGWHVLIRGEELFGFFATEDAALEEGFRRFGRAPFLVKQIRLDEGPRPLVWTIL
jgi:hypothetical protein